jgi:hypothetical protein
MRADRGQPFQQIFVDSRSRLSIRAAVAWLLSSATFVTSQAVVSVTRVSTPLGLKDAIESGAPHVHIINHLNLIALPTVTTVAITDDDIGVVPSLFQLGDTLQSLTVRVDAWNC